MHDHGNNVTATLVDVRFNNGSARNAIWICLQFEEVCFEKDLLEKLRNVRSLLCRNLCNLELATPVFDQHAVISKLLANAVGICFRTVNLVDRNNDRHIRSLRVRDSFDRLRHHAIVGGNNQHNDVCNLSTTSTHSCKGFVTRCIEECDLPT